MPNTDIVVERSSNLFFRKLQPLLLFGKMIGICGIKTIFVDNVYSLKREPSSLQALAMVVRFCFCFYSILISIRDCKVDIEEQLANASNILATIICLRSDGILIRIIWKTDNHVRRTKERCIYGGFFVCLVLCTHMSGIYDLRASRRFDDVIFVKFICLVYHKCGCVVMIMQFLWFTEEIKRQFEDLIDQLKDIYTRAITEGNVEWCRNRYEFLICTVEDLNSSIGLRLLIPICAIPIELLVYFYRLVFEKKWQMSLLDLSVLMVYFIAVHYIASIGSEMKKMVSLKELI